MNTLDQNQPKTVIKCKHCGAEYTLDEIFYPDDIIGFPKDIIKDPLGHILYVGNWKDDAPTYKEKYICDYCKKPFNVELKISVVVTNEDEALDFTNLSSNLLQ